MSLPLVQSGNEVARAMIYRLLGRLWLREVDEELLGQLAHQPLRDAFVEAGGQLPANHDADTVEELQVDYCQLFVGPSQHLPPFQSVWQTGQFNGKPTDSLKQFTEISGYDTNWLPPGMLHDHLGIQLDIMAHLLTELAESSPNNERRDGIGEVAGYFFANHLQWPTNLLNAATKQASTDFYRSVALLTKRFLQSEGSQTNTP